MSRVLLGAGHRNGTESILSVSSNLEITQIADLVSSTVSRWDPDETSWKLELLLGRDLQFIRVNGTLVGALAGVLIHAIAELIG